MRAVAIGDSTIYGRHDPHGGWIGRLRIHSESSDMWNAVFNMGIGGTTSDMLRNRWRSEVIPRVPDTVIIGCGLNDLRRDPAGLPEVEINQFVSNLTEMLQGLKSSGDIAIYLATMHPINPGTMDGFDYNQDDWDSYNKVIRSTATRFGSRIIPFDDANTSGFVTNSCLADRIHPNTQGHQILAEIATRTIS